MREHQVFWIRIFFDCERAFFLFRPSPPGLLCCLVGVTVLPLGRSVSRAAAATHDWRAPQALKALARIIGGEWRELTRGRRPRDVGIVVLVRRVLVLVLETGLRVVHIRVWLPATAEVIVYPGEVVPLVLPVGLSAVPRVALQLRHGQRQREHDGRAPRLLLLVVVVVVVVGVVLLLLLLGSVVMVVRVRRRRALGSVGVVRVRGRGGRLVRRWVAVAVVAEAEAEARALGGGRVHHLGRRWPQHGPRRYRGARVAARPGPVHDRWRHHHASQAPRFLHLGWGSGWGSGVSATWAANKEKPVSIKRNRWVPRYLGRQNQCREHDSSTS